MKRIMMTIAAALTMVLAAQAMSYEDARREALFLTDKMAYELGLNDAQYEAVYEINFDYFSSISSSKNIKGTYLSRRNYDINFVLTATQYSKFYKADYFYTPVKWDGGIVVKVYTRYPDRVKMYYPAPRVYMTYRGEHGKKYNNISWYKGRDFRNSAAIGHGRPPQPGIGHGARPAQPQHSTGHGIRPSHNNNTTNHGGIGHGATPVKPQHSTGHGMTHKPNTDKPANKPATGIGHGVTPNNQAKPGNQGVGHGVSVGNSGVGSGVSVGNSGVGSGVSVGNSGVGSGVSVGNSGVGSGASGTFKGKR